jgi:alkylhydroperoxidase/carboxymuconolactone decarboxylase family protein YurZ
MAKKPAPPKRPDLPKDIARVVEKYYVSLFDEFPLFPAERLALGAKLSPDYTRMLEELRAKVLFSGAIDEKTVQLMAVGHLAARASAGTYWHCKAARKLGARWEEIHQAIEISALFNGFSAINEGGQALVRLYKEEQAAKGRGKLGRRRGLRN